MRPISNSGYVWIIDAAYVLQGHTTTIDYLQLKDTIQQWACGGKSFDQIIFYNSVVEGGKADNFHEFLRNNGFEVKLYPLKRSGYTCESCGHRGTKYVQRGVDVAICTDLLRLAYEGKFKRVVMTAGDGDLLDAVKLVKSRFQEVYLTGYRHSMSNDLVSVADNVHWM